MEETRQFLVRRVADWVTQEDELLLRLEGVRCRWNKGPVRPMVITAENPNDQFTNTNTPNRVHLANRPEWEVETRELAISLAGPRTLRFTLGPRGGRDFGILIDENLSRLPIQLEELSVTDHRGAPGQLHLTGGHLTATIDLDPFDLVVRHEDGTLVARLPMDDRDVHGLLHVLPAGFGHGPDGPESLISFSLEPGEHLYGLGEQFGPLDKAGKSYVLWNADAWGTTTSGCYKPVPVLLSSRGYGLFVHTPARLTAELGTISTASFTLTTAEEALDLFLMAGPSLKDVLGAYTDLTGRAPVPPAWAFGLWMSRCRYQSREEVERIGDRMRAEGIPCDVLHVDPAWLKVASLNCDFEWSGSFPEPEGMLSGLRKRGFKLSFWELPYLAESTPSYQEALRLGYLVKDCEGNPIQPDAIQGTDGRPRGIVDFTNPAARRWWQDKHRPMLRMGAAVFKTDFGEGTPVGSRFADGSDGLRRHNLYPLLYNRAVAEVIAEETGRTGLVWGRSGWAGSHRYPGQWGGDPQTSLAAMAGTLRGGLSYSVSCPGIWSHDIGGFYGPPPSPALYARWAQFGMLSPLARAHGTTPREPWEFGERAAAIFKEFALLRYRLVPYLVHTARLTARDGLPMMRPLLLEFQDDPGVANLDDQYMLGPDLLVAPVFSESEEPVERPVYLPEGGWYDWWTGRAVPGGHYVRDVVPPERVPLYVRAGTAIPTTHVRQFLDEGPVPVEELLLFPPLDGSSVAELLLDGAHEDRATTVRQSVSGNLVRVEIENPPDSLASVRLAGRESVAIDARADGSARLEIER